MIRPDEVLILKAVVPRHAVAIGTMLIDEKRVRPRRHGEVFPAAIGIVGLVRACVAIPYHESGVVGYVIAIEIDEEEVPLGQTRWRPGVNILKLFGIRKGVSIEPVCGAAAACRAIV